MGNYKLVEPIKALEPFYRTEWVTDNFAIFTAMIANFMGHLMTIQLIFVD